MKKNITNEEGYNNEECFDFDEDIEILETRKKNEDYGEVSVGIVSDDLWGDWNRDNLVKKRRNLTDVKVIGNEPVEDIVTDDELKIMSKNVFKSQSSNYYNGVLNNELKKSDLYDKFRNIYIHGYYYGYDIKNKKLISLKELIKKLPKESKENIYIKALYNANKDKKIKAKEKNNSKK